MARMLGFMSLLITRLRVFRQNKARIGGLRSHYWRARRKFQRCARRLNLRRMKKLRVLRMRFSAAGCAGRFRKRGTKDSAAEPVEGQDTVLLEVTRDSGELARIVIRDKGGVGIEFRFEGWLEDPRCGGGAISLRGSSRGGYCERGIACGAEGRERNRETINSGFLRDTLA